MTIKTIAPRMSLRPLAAAGEAELLIYGDIGEDFWGGESVSARQVVDQLAAVSADLINVRINSYGGSVSDGLAIYNALRSHRALVRVTVDGVAISAASLIAMAGDEVVMNAASVMMIHAPLTIAAGNAVEMRETAAALDTYAAALAEAYAQKTGKPLDEMLAIVSDGKDHWYTGREAVAAGFADSVAGGDPAEGDTQATLTAAIAGAARFLDSAPQRIAAALRVAPNPTAGEEPMTAPNAAANPADILAQAHAAVRQRNDSIHAALNDVMDVPGIRDLYQDALRDPTMSVENVLQRALAVQSAHAQPANGGGRIEGGQDQRDKYIAGVSNAVLARSGIEKIEPGNQYAGIRLQNIVRGCLRAANVGGADRMEGSQLAERVLAMHTSSDFPLLIANTANKALRAGYEMAETTYRSWAAIGEVSDFKANSRIQLGTFNSLAEIRPGGEYTYGSVGEEAETITAITKGKGLALTRQLIINDDLGAFIGAARMMGFAADRTVNEDVYARLAAATAMSDGGALFNATAVTTAGGHANLTSSGTALTVASIAAGEAMMAAQKDKNLRTTLNLRPKFLLVPRGKRYLAWELMNSSADPSSSNSNKRNYVSSLDMELISDSELDKASATAWYLATDPNIAPLIEVDFLDGNQNPYVAESIDWDTDAMKFKVRLDYGVQALEWRGGYKNNGA